MKGAVLYVCKRRTGERDQGYRCGPLSDGYTLHVRHGPGDLSVPGWMLLPGSGRDQDQGGHISADPGALYHIPDPVGRL